MEEKELFHAKSTHGVKQILLCLFLCFIAFVYGCVKESFYEEFVMGYSLSRNEPFKYGNHVANIALILALFFALFIPMLCNSEMIITTKRIYGKTKFGKRVSIPLNNISFVSLSSFSGISLGTSSGIVKFYGVKDRNTVYEKVSQLLNNKQK